MAQLAALTKAPVTKPPALRTTAPFVQAKLKLGAANDRFEREADSAATAVTSGERFSIPPTITPIGAGLTQRACSACKLGDEETRGAIQRKCATCAATAGSCECDQEEKEEEGLAQRKADRRSRRSASQGTSAVEDVVSTPGRPLPAAVRQEMEQGFGRDFSRVRIHDSPRAAASAEAIGAHAYTVGNHIAFNQGQFRPDTTSGRFLLAHELAHTVQQTGARPARMDRVSHPADRHEAEANRAAQAAVSGAPMPALSPGGAPISRLDAGDVALGVLSFASPAVGHLRLGSAAVDLAGDALDFAGDLLGDASGALSGLLDTALAIAEAVRGQISFDGTTIVIDIPQFEPCPEFEFQFQLSDIGLDPTLYFPIAAGGFTVGVLSVLGALGITVNLDPGLAFRLEGCSFGPAQIRISPLPPRVTVMGATSITTGAAVTLGTDIGLRADVMGVMTIPSVPPIVLVAPAVGVTAGGTFAFMLQHRDILQHYFAVSMGIGDFSAASHIGADIGFGLDLAAGLFGSVDLMGLELCRVGWPLFSYHTQTAARLTMDAALAVGTSGLSFQFAASARPLADNPLDDLSFVFDQSRLEDDCWLCEFFLNNNLMPGQNGYNWATLEPRMPRLPGPLPRVYARDPMFASGALCRGTCGINCPPPPSCDEPRDRIECEERGDRHYWHTYVNYAKCGSHQGCRDHDSCYDYAAMMPIWGFGGILIGPMYRACDLEALCKYSFRQAVTWATGGGPYDSRLAYADRVNRRPGCLGPCPKNVAPEGEPEEMKTCLQNRELWTGLTISDSWGKPFGPWTLYRGFIRVPYIGGIHYGIDGSAAVGAAASATLGPINLENACLTYNPATFAYTGSADLVAYLAGFASASVTGQLSGWGADLICLLRWLTVRVKLTGDVSVVLPGEVRARVRLECRNGDLEVIPSLSLKVEPSLRVGLTAGAEFDVLWKTVVSREWKLFEESIDRKWEIGFEFDPFFVGQQPDFHLFTDALDVLDLLLDVFEPGREHDVDHRPAQNPIAETERSLVAPCLDDDDDEDDQSHNCPTQATGADGDRLTTPGQRAPTYGGATTLTITSGASAGVATWMEAPFLTSSHPPGEETNATVQAGIYKQPGLPTNSCVGKGYKQSQVYIKGHLLNAGAGGPAEERNLFPITGQANADHKNQVEQHGLRVVPRVNSGNEVIYYKVTVQNISTPSEILTSSGAGTNLYELSATFHCEVANYQLCTNDTLQRNAVQTVNIRSQFVFHPSGGKAFDTIMRPCPR